ncbi:two pore domain potassium channel family protein [Mumia zhuanghuii]|uniref:Potassium channel family protein n=2 Tax=Mumia TaxID=1546255 RepID=A0ABW1QP30_9ACTN|nr:MULTISPECIES: potassium channel family protein [Mumia]KAA1420675.1 two pore domain potassium channel family protein [Mumia zhuanghuii]
MDTDSRKRRTPRQDRYGLLLVLLSVVLLLVPIDVTALRPLVTALLGAVLLFAQRTSGARRSVIGVSAVLVAISVVTSAAAQVAEADAAALVYSGIVIVLCLATIATIGAHLIRDPALDVHIVLGVIAVFVLLGIAFAGAYSMLGVWGNGFFAEADGSHDAVDYFYFSFITITTTGYGDLTPAGDVGKMVAAFEALIGQVYLVTVVSLAVSGVTRRRTKGD